LFLYNNIHSVIILAILSPPVTLSTAKDFSLFSNKSDSMDYSQESTNRTTFHGRQRCPPHSNQLSCVLYFYEYHSSQQSFSPLLLDPLLSNYVQTVSPIISSLSIL